MPRVIEIAQAMTDFEALVEAAAAGEEIVLADNGVPQARPVPAISASERRNPSGAMQITYIPDDFDETDEAVIRGFEGSE